MALPELIANSKVPGSVVALTTLKSELNATATTLETEAAAFAGLWP
jgi:hypothetical protein